LFPAEPVAAASHLDINAEEKKYYEIFLVTALHTKHIKPNTANAQEAKVTSRRAQPVHHKEPSHTHRNDYQSLLQSSTFSPLPLPKAQLHSESKAIWDLKQSKQNDQLIIKVQDNQCRLNKIISSESSISRKRYLRQQA